MQYHIQQQHPSLLVLGCLRLILIESEMGTKDAFVIVVAVLTYAAAIPLNDFTKRDISGLDNLDHSGTIQQIIVNNEEESSQWHGDPHISIQQEGWKQESQGWKSPQHLTRTVTVEKQVPVKVYKPIYIEKKVHVPHEVVVEKRIPVLVERSTTRRHGLLNRRFPSFNITVTPNVMRDDDEDLDDPETNDDLEDAIRDAVERILDARRDRDRPSRRRRGRTGRGEVLQGPVILPQINPFDQFLPFLPLPGSPITGNGLNNPFFPNFG